MQLFADNIISSHLSHNVNTILLLTISFPSVNYFILHILMLISLYDTVWRSMSFLWGINMYHTWNIFRVLLKLPFLLQLIAEFKLSTTGQCSKSSSLLSSSHGAAEGRYIFVRCSLFVSSDVWYLPPFGEATSSLSYGHLKSRQIQNALLWYLVLHAVFFVF